MFEVMLGGGTRVKDKEFVPSKDNMFIREVPAAEFITGDQLAIAVGLTVGTSQNSTAGWLHYIDTVDGKTKYVAKKPLRHTVTWNDLNTKGVVFGTMTVAINGDTYKVRLLKGSATDPHVGSYGFDLPGTHGSEWNRLLYHISGKPFTNASNRLTSEGITTGDWASYSEADLGMHGSFGNGSYSWCQEVGTDPMTRVRRGESGVSYSNLYTSSTANLYCGWRPVLELVE